MSDKIHKAILKATSAKQAFEIKKIQSLWSGYGKISRYGLIGTEQQSVVVKHVMLPKDENMNHPRGWNTKLSHQRKLKSYHVESQWYRQWSQVCDSECRVPKCFHVQDLQDEFLMILEDLDASGFPVRKEKASMDDMLACLSWLANFHATFMHQVPQGLWTQGSYWHLATRPDELAALKDEDLKGAASILDHTLNNSPFQTIIHGDAKLANFCFAKDSNKVAAVDFQYVGGGCGMKDVALFISSCLDEQESARLEEKLLDAYFAELKKSLQKRGHAINANELEENWRSLYCVAWADFIRFIKGWCPDHWKIHAYSESLTQRAIEQCQINKA